MVKYRVNLERGVWCPSNVKKIHFCFINPWRTIRFFRGSTAFSWTTLQCMPCITEGTQNT